VNAVRKEMALAETMHEGGAGPSAADAIGAPDLGAGALGASSARADTLDIDALQDKVVEDLIPGFDPEWGGFGPAPKFPRPSLVELCLRRARRGGEDAQTARLLALRTLDAMAAGGIYDHIVGGFCRYSTDARWLVPHFEKMLTDQALLARAYLHAWLETGQRDYLGVVTETLDFVLRDLSTPEGALYSSFDADAGGVEGGHATFTPADLEAALPPELRRPAAEWYGISERGNWEGRSIPVRPVGDPLARPEQIEEARSLLAALRATRVQPARDEKVLTEWNAMAASTLAETASATGIEAYGTRAEEIGEFLWTSMYVDGRLMRSWQGGRARHLGVAADHAWLAEAFIRLSEWSGRAHWRTRALQVSGQLIDLFRDEEHGGFFTTGKDAEQLVVRPKEFIDGAVPASNSVAVASLLRAAALTEDPRLEEAATETIELARPLLERHPGALADLVAALPMQDGRQDIVVTGRRPDLVAEARRRWLPAAVLAWGEPDDGPLFVGRPAETAAAYVCRQRTCLLPAHDPQQLAAQLDDVVLNR
jgi:uncharacterized protein YyaL (SSP411 family)